MSLAVQVPPSRGGDNDSELLSSARCPAQFAAALDSALLQAKREADGITAAQLRLAGALGAGAAYGLGLWSASGAEVATVWLGATAAGLAASSTSLLLYLIIFRFFQLVPVLQERVGGLKPSTFLNHHPTQAIHPSTRPPRHACHALTAQLPARR